MRTILTFLFIALNFTYAQHKKCLIVTKSIDGQFFALYSDSTWSVINESVYNSHNIVTNKVKFNTPTPTKSNSINSPIGQSSARNRSSNSNNSTDKSNYSRGSSLCGARTKKGSPCQRRVAGGGYCWQHR